LDDEDDAVDEWGVEAGGEFLRDGFGLAAFDAGCGFEVALGVEGEGEESDGGGEDGAGDPEAGVRVVHEVTRSPPVAAS
jgi:hypothetical protein